MSKLLRIPSKLVQILFVPLLATTLLFSPACQRQEPEPAQVSQKKADNMFVSLDEAGVAAGNTLNARFSPSSAAGDVKATGGKNGRVGLPQKKVLDRFTITEEGSNKPAFYVFNYEGGGFVVIAADKRIMPVMAYSEGGYYGQQNKPYGLKLWEQVNQKGIKEVRMVNATPHKAVTREWARVQVDLDKLSSSRLPPEEDPGDTYYQITKGPFLPVRWGQGCGYNSLCPAVSSGGDCGRAWTGCVATAMAQVMRYWRHPARYNWDAMPVNWGNGDVARLMSDAGVSVGMSYGGDGSGAKHENVDDALKNTFGYSSATDISYDFSSSYNNVNYGLGKG